MIELTISSAFLIGLLGSSHCLAMCGGLSSALGAGQEQHRGRLLSYNIGRILTYGLIGALAGLLGEQMVAAAPQLGLVLRTIAGLLLVAMGLYVSQWWMGLTHLEKVGAKLWRHIQPLTRSLIPVKNHRQALMLGGLWGLLPCGLVYSTLSWALAAAHWQQSALFMLFFGLGTLPAMLSVGFINEKILARLRKKNYRVVAGLIIVVMGIITIVTPWLHSEGAHSEHGNHAVEHQHIHNN